MNKNRQATTFYLPSRAGKKEIKALNILSTLGRKKMDFLVWMIDVVEMNYNIDLGSLSQKELLSLENAPIPQQGQIAEMLERLSTALANQNVKPSKKISKNPTPVYTAEKEILLKKKSKQPAVTSEDSLLEDELSASQSNMLFAGLSGFGI